MGTQFAPEYNAPPQRFQRGNRPPTVYPFNDASVEPLYELLLKSGKIQPLEPPPCPEHIGRTDDPRYCVYHRCVGHPTENCWALKDRLEGLVQAKVL